MTLDEAIALLKQGLGFRTDLDNEITAELQAAQDELEGENRSLPKFLIQEDQTLNILASTQSVALPTGFIREVEDEGPNYVSTDEGRIFLTKLTKKEADIFYATSDPGKPRAYVKRQTTLLVYPVPDIAYTLTWSYFKSSPFPTGGTETNLWLTTWPRLLIGRAGMSIAEDIRAKEGDNSPYMHFARMFDIWNTKWMAQLASEDDANMPRAMGLNN